MRTWLFYRTEPDGNYTFRRVEHAGAHTGIVEPLNRPVSPREIRSDLRLGDSAPIGEKEIRMFVSKTGWSGAVPMSASSPVADAVLKGSW
jgi:hypothetical protein